MNTNAELDESSVIIAACIIFNMGTQINLFSLVSSDMN